MVSHAAEQGDPDAQNNLGLMYAVGTGVLEDPIYALMWFELAAANGSEGAKKNIIASEKIFHSRIYLLLAKWRPNAQKNIKIANLIPLKTHR